MPLISKPNDPMKNIKWTDVISKRFLLTVCVHLDVRRFNTESNFFMEINRDNTRNMAGQHVNQLA